MFDIKDDYLVAGDELKKLLEGIEGVRAIYSQNELGDVEEKAQHTPALHVLYQGDSLPDTAQGGTTQQLKQVWVVVIACRLSIHEHPGKLITHVIKRLAGKTSQVDGKTMGPWVRVPTPLKPRYTQSHGYYPLAFSAQFRFNNQ